MVKKFKDEMSFLEHLEELRWVIIKSLFAIVVGGTIAFFFRQFIFDNIILIPRTPEFITNKILCKIGAMINSQGLCINQNPVELQNITMGGQFNMHIRVAIISGFIISFPYIFYQFWNFVAPALKPNERKYARSAIIYSSLLFIIGILFGYFILLPFSIDFLTSYSVSEQIENKINFVSYVTNITSVVLACGIIFELPIVVYFLASVGILTSEIMKKYWKHAIVIILVIAAIITPPDVVSQVLVSLPLFLLYLASILIAKKIEIKRIKEE